MALRLPWLLGLAPSPPRTVTGVQDALRLNPREAAAIAIDAHGGVGRLRRVRVPEEAVALSVATSGATADVRAPSAPWRAAEAPRHDLDLALLRIRTTVDGRPLPAGTRFPSLSIPEAGTPRASLGTSPRTITLSRGIVSGFARELEGLVDRTDAAVHAGVSGGACIDASGTLLGLPLASIVDLNLGRRTRLHPPDRPRAGCVARAYRALTRPVARASRIPTLVHLADGASIEA